MMINLKVGYEHDPIMGVLLSSWEWKEKSKDKDSHKNALYRTRKETFLIYI